MNLPLFSPTFGRFGRLALACSLLGGIVSAARAATKTWVGLGANNNWSTGANWSGGAAPVNGDSLQFGGTTRLNPVNDLANLSVAGINFLAGAGTFSITGNGITSTGNIVNGAFNEGLRLNVTLGAAQIWRNDGTGQLDVGTPSGNLNLNSQSLSIRGTGNKVAVVGLTGTGTVGTDGKVFLGEATYQGALYVAGETTVYNLSALNAAVSVSGTLAMTEDLTLGSLSGTGRVLLIDPGSGSGSPTPTLTIGTNDFSSNISSTFHGSIEGQGDVVKAGSGTLTLASGLYSHRPGDTGGGGTRVAEGTLNLTNGIFASGAPIQIDAGATVNATGFVNRGVTGEGALAGSGMTILGGFAEPFTHAGSFDVSGLTQLAGLGQAQLGGDVNLAAGATLTTLNQFDGIGLLGGGVVNASSGGTIDGNFVNNGTVHGATTSGQLLTFTDLVSGAGSFTGNVLFSDGYSPGNSPAIVSHENLFLDASSVLTMELGGLTAGTGYDKLIFSGMAFFDGTFDVRTILGFTPGAGQSFDLFDGTLTGTFDTLLLPDLQAGLSWDQSQLYTTGVLSVAGTSAVPDTAAPFWALLLPIAVAAMRRRSAASA